MKQVNTAYLITDFNNLAAHKWQIVNDGVMGGISQSQLQIQENGNAVFLGTLSLENNGGFASVKNRNSLNLEGYSVIKLHVKGDGKRYSFRFRTGSNGTFHDWVYEHRFETKRNVWQFVELPLMNFRATYRGQKLANVPEPDLTSIREYGFLISDQQEGDFRLEIKEIKALI